MILFAGDILHDGAKHANTEVDVLQYLWLIFGLSLQVTATLEVWEEALFSATLVNHSYHEWQEVMQEISFFLLPKSPLLEQDNNVSTFQSLRLN